LQGLQNFRTTWKVQHNNVLSEFISEFLALAWAERLTRAGDCPRVSGAIRSVLAWSEDGGADTTRSPTPVSPFHAERVQGTSRVSANRVSGQDNRSGFGEF
jgi:hypothetical protein